MLIGALLGVVVVLGVVAAVLLRRRSYDDDHSVEHYHRSLHTLEEMRAHSPTGVENGHGEVANPASAFRVSESSTVRLTEGTRPAVPPVPPPPVPNPAKPVTFDDAGPESGSEPGSEAGTGSTAATAVNGFEDRVVHIINHRPRRLGGPAAAVAAVAVLIVILIITGLHTNAPTHHAKGSSTATTTGTHPRPAGRRSTTTTATSAPLAVSAPTATTAHGATYQVANASYSLSLAATSGECWINATNTATGSVLFTGTLLSGQSHTIVAAGPVTVVAGAPAAFAATVNGASVTLPLGYQAPFTLRFESAQLS